MVEGEEKFYEEISGIVGKSRTTVQRLAKCYENRGAASMKTKKKLYQRKTRWLEKEVRKNLKKSVPRLASEIEAVTGEKVHPENVRRIPT